MGPVLRLCVWLALRILLRTAFRFRVRGAEGIPRTGPFVLAANHTSHVDTLALVASLPWSRVNDTPPLAAEDYFFRRRWLGALVRLLFNARPVDRQAGLETALTGARALLEAGHGVILYPEGTRSITGALGRFRRGVGSLLAGTSCPVIPVAIVGAHDVLPKGARWPRPGPVRLIMGDPVSYEREANSPEGWQRIAVDLERRVRALGEEARREATPARRALKLTRRAAVPSRPAFWPPFER